MSGAGLAAEAGAFLLLFARVGTVLMLLPLLGEDAVPGRIRLLAAFAVTMGLWSLLRAGVEPLAGDPAALPGLLLAELLTGLAIGAVIRLMFQAAAMAGAIASQQVGLTSALVSDPSQGGQAALLSRLAVLVATCACLAANVHHLWIAALVRSYALFPVGGLPAAGDFAALAVRSVGDALALAVGMAAPLIVYGLVFNLALGLATRLAPAIQLFFIVQPLAILLGLALFAVLLGPMMLAFSDAMGAFITGWR